MRRSVVALALALAASGGLACSQGTAPTPSTPIIPTLAFVPGQAPTNYSGSIQDSVYGTGSAAAALATVAGLTTGTFTMSFPNRPKETVYPSGAVSNGSYHANLYACAGAETGPTSCTSSCSFVADSSLTGNKWSGTYTSIVTPNCSTPRSGSFRLTKQ
jgi:hypothetical protein